MITNTQSGTNIQEISSGIYRINTPVDIPGSAFSFNQYLVLADDPLLFHTGPKKMFPLVSEAIARVMPLDRLRYVGFSHYEADECGSLAEFLVVAPTAETRSRMSAKMIPIDDVSPRAARGLVDAELEGWFDEAEAATSPGVMIIWQDDPFDGTSDASLVSTLKKRATAFGKPVVLVQGDTHSFKIDHPWSGVPKFTRVVTFGTITTNRWVRATVDPTSPAVFSFTTIRS
jgi:hypothetical protein